MGGAARFSGGRVEIADGSVLALASRASLPAAASLTVPQGVSLVVVQAADGKQDNALSMAPGVEGQILLVLDLDDDPLHLSDADDKPIGPGILKQLVYVAGKWHVVE